METISSGTRKASKDYICNYCGGKINKGDEYNYQNNKYADELYTWRTHNMCDVLASHYNMHDYADEGLTGDDFQEHIDEIYHDELTTSDKVKYLYKKLKENEGTEI